MTEDEIAKIIVQAAYNVHVQLGPGLLESAYEACLLFELRYLGLEVFISSGFAPKLQRYAT